MKLSRTQRNTPGPATRNEPVLQVAPNAGVACRPSRNEPSAAKGVYRSSSVRAVAAAARGPDRAEIAMTMRGRVSLRARRATAAILVLRRSAGAV